MLPVHRHCNVLTRLQLFAQTVILGCLSAGVLPQDPNGLYYLISSPEVAQKGFCVDYCGWHDVGPNNMLCVIFQCFRFCVHALPCCDCLPCNVLATIPTLLSALPCLQELFMQSLCIEVVQGERSKVNTAYDVCRYGFVGSTLRCPNTCQVQTVGPNGGSALDGVASILAHEISETISDPYTDAWCALVPTRNGFN